MQPVAISSRDERGDAGSLARWIGRELRCNALVYVLIFLFLAYSVALSLLLGDSLLSFLHVYAARALRAVILICCAFLVIALVRYPACGSESSLAGYLHGFFLAPRSVRFAARYVFACLALALFMGIFMYNKTKIPLIEPYSWDPVLARWDAALFGGRQAWAVLHPVLGFPVVTYLLDFFYALWVPLVFVVWAGLLASERVPCAIRQQFWLATLMSWIVIGLIMATAFSSVGPCYAAHFFPRIAPEFARLNAYLSDLNAHVPLASSTSKAYLLDIYKGTLAEPGGISAMPSMHNAQAVLFALTAFRLDRRLGCVFSLYAVLIFVGSIALAWHYAVDGIVGGLAAAVLWYLARLLPKAAIGVTS